MVEQVKKTQTRFPDSKQIPYICQMDLKDNKYMLILRKYFMITAGVFIAMEISIEIIGSEKTFSIVAGAMLLSFVMALGTYIWDMYQTKSEEVEKDVN